MDWAPSNFTVSQNPFAGCFILSECVVFFSFCLSNKPLERATTTLGWASRKLGMWGQQEIGYVGQAQENENQARPGNGGLLLTRGGSGHGSHRAP